MIDLRTHGKLVARPHMEPKNALLQCSKLGTGEKSSIKIADKCENLVFEDQFDGIFGHIYPVISGSNYMKKSVKLQPFFLDPAC